MSAGPPLCASLGLGPQAVTEATGCSAPRLETLQMSSEITLKTRAPLDSGSSDSFAGETIIKPRAVGIVDACEELGVSMHDDSGFAMCFRALDPSDGASATAGGTGHISFTRVSNRYRPRSILRGILPNGAPRRGYCVAIATAVGRIDLLGQDDSHSQALCSRMCRASARDFHETC